MGFEERLWKWYERHDNAVNTVLEIACNAVPGAQAVFLALKAVHSWWKDREENKDDDKVEEIQEFLSTVKPVMSDLVEEIEDMNEFQSAKNPEERQKIVEIKLPKSLNEVLSQISPSVNKSLSRLSSRTSPKRVLNDRYEVVSLLGSGGQGEVYCAKDLKIEKLVAVKILPAILSNDATAISSLKDEYNRVVDQLVHANIVQYRNLDQDLQTQRYFLVMDFVPGKNMRKWMLGQTKKLISFEKAVKFLIPIAQALDFAHKNKIVHCDLKPENILIRDSDGKRVLTDFGLSKEIRSSLSKRSAQGDVSGTLPYMSPEQYMGRNPDARTDIWALGVILYEMVAGFHPFQGTSFEHYMKLVCDVKPEKLEHLSAEEWGCLVAMLQKDKGQRPMLATQALQVKSIIIEKREEEPPIKPPEKKTETPQPRLFTGPILGIENVPIKIIEKPQPSLQTIVVSPLEKHKKISDALLDAQSGARIVVKAGVYKESVVIDKPVQIVAEGAVTIESKEYECFLMRAEQAVVRGFTLQGKMGSKGKFFAVDIPQGQLVLEQCDITCDSLSCVAVHGDNASCILSRCKLHDSKEGDGILVYGNGKAEVRDCEIFSNDLTGVEIRAGGKCFVQNCKIHDSKGSDGILVHDNGTGDIRDCEIFSNALTGIEVRVKGNCVVQNCRIHDSKERGAGILVYENAKAEIIDSEVFSNTLNGVEVRTGGNCMLQNCKIHDIKEKGAGVLVHDNGVGEIKGCEIFSNTLNDIEIKTGGNCTVINSVIHDSKSDGILVHDKGKAEIRDCEIFSNEINDVEIRANSNCVIQNCRIHDSQNVGVLVHEKGTGEIRDCEIFSNALTGVEIRTDANCVVQRCTIRTNGYQAVYVHAHGKGTIENCDLRGNRQGAWYIEAGCQVQRGGNRES